MAINIGRGPMSAEEAREGAMLRVDSARHEREEKLRDMTWEKIRSAVFAEGHRVVALCFEADMLNFVCDVAAGEVRAQGFDVVVSQDVRMMTVRW